jgi:site-specific DNA-methyltransferase (adenine-specific)
MRTKECSDYFIEKYFIPELKKYMHLPKREQDKRIAENLCIDTGTVRNIRESLQKAVIICRGYKDEIDFSRFQISHFRFLPSPRTNREKLEHVLNGLKNGPVTVERIEELKKEYELTKRLQLVEFNGVSTSYIIYCKSSESMNEVPDNNVHLVLISPPYNAGISYDVYNDSRPLKEHRMLMLKVFRECYNKLVTGGRIALVVPSVIKDNHKPVNAIPYFHGILEECNFHSLAQIVWIKPNLPIPRHQNWGSYCSPRSPVIRSISEFILVYYKETPFLEGEASDITPDEFKNWTINVWNIPHSKNSLHPAVFPEELAIRLIKLYTFIGQTVLDPFCGIGTTGVACARLNRCFIGYDISPNYCKIAKLRIEETRTVELNLQEILKTIDLEELFRFREIAPLIFTG